MDYLIGVMTAKILMPLSMAQFFYGFFIMGISLCAYCAVYNFGKLIFKGGLTKDEFGSMFLAMACLITIVYGWTWYENRFFDCEKVLANSNESDYSCRVRKEYNGLWSDPMIFGSDPYKKYDVK